MQSKTKKKWKDGFLYAEIDREECEVRWYFVVNGEVENAGSMLVELYGDDTWLAYWETYLPTRIPKVLRDVLLGMFRKIGMLEDDEV